MANPEINIIAALARESRVIGKDGKIPWHISADLKRFRELTIPHPIIMGRKTFESIGKPLPNRVNIVVSRTQNYNHPDNTWIQTAESLEDAVYTGSIFSETGKMFIIGGGQIYREALSWYMIDQISKLYLTLVEGDYQGDTFFPDYSEFQKEISREVGEENELKFEFVILAR